MSLMGVMEGLLPLLGYVFMSEGWMLSSLRGEGKLIQCSWQRVRAAGDMAQWEALVACGSLEWEPQTLRDKQVAGGKEGVWEGLGGVVCLGTQGPQAGAEWRKRSRECGLLWWYERHAWVPCVSARGGMIDQERVRDMAWGRQVVGKDKAAKTSYRFTSKKYPLYFCLNIYIDLFLVSLKVVETKQQLSPLDEMVIIIYLYMALTRSNMSHE